MPQTLTLPQKPCSTITANTNEPPYNKKARILRLIPLKSLIYKMKKPLFLIITRKK